MKTTHRVMLDSDAAMLYHYTTKNINKAVKRNVDRFPEEFCFQLNENGRGQHRKYLPYVFTEQGISMLSGMLKNEIVVKVSVNIMKTFVEMRKFLMLNGQVFERLTSMEYKLLEHDKKIDEVFNQLQQVNDIKETISKINNEEKIENLNKYIEKIKEN